MRRASRHREACSGDTEDREKAAWWWRRWTGHLTLSEWSALVSVAAWLWFILLALPQWRPALKKPLRGYTATAGLVAAFLSACLALNYYDRFETQSAIVVAREA